MSEIVRVLQQRLQRAQAQCFVLDLEDQPFPFHPGHGDPCLGDQALHDRLDDAGELIGRNLGNGGQVHPVDQFPVDVALELLVRLDLGVLDPSPLRQVSQDHDGSSVPRCLPVADAHFDPLSWLNSLPRIPPLVDSGVPAFGPISRSAICRNPSVTSLPGAISRSNFPAVDRRNHRWIIVGNGEEDRTVQDSLDALFRNLLIGKIAVQHQAHALVPQPEAAEEVQAFLRVLQGRQVQQGKQQDVVGHLQGRQRPFVELVRSVHDDEVEHGSQGGEDLPHLRSGDPFGVLDHRRAREDVDAAGMFQQKGVQEVVIGLLRRSCARSRME